jgi:hypothetical protein
MAICHPCKEEFGSEQGVKAHMKKCELYQAHKRNKQAAALGMLPKAASSPVAMLPIHAIPPIAATDFSSPLREFEKAMHESSTKQEAPSSPQQQRRKILQAAKTQVINHYWTPLGQVTASLRGGAKLTIERELSSLPLEELPFEEVCDLAAAIRDRGYGPAFTRQAREAERQRVEREKRHKDEVEALGALVRADRRKKILIQQASQQAHAYCQEKAIIGWAHLSVLVDVESRLDALLTGDEPILEAQAIVRSVLEARFAEAEATLAAAQAKATERWYEDVSGVLMLGALAGLVVLAIKYPAQALPILNWIERIFGYMPGAEAGAQNPEAPKTDPTAASAEARPRSTRRRKDPVAPSSPEPPWGNSVGGEPAHA